MTLVLTVSWIAVMLLVALVGRAELARTARSRQRFALGGRGRPRDGEDLLPRPGQAVSSASQDPPRTRRVVIVAVIVLAVTLVKPVIGMGLALGVLVTAHSRRRRGERLRIEQLRREIPEIVDLFRIATGSGSSVPMAMSIVGTQAGGPVGHEFGRAAERIRHGQPTAEALEALAIRVGEPVRPLVAMLLASVRYGARLGPALERLAHSCRLEQRRRAEESARRVPVRLLLPLVLCILPAFGLLSVVPLMANSLLSLDQSGFDIETP